MLRFSVFAAVGALAAAPAMAAPFLHYLVAQDAPHVIVWRDDDAMGLGLKLIASGQATKNTAMLQSLVACFADSGSAAIIRDGGFYTSTVIVTSGNADGCSGVIDNGFLKDALPGN